MANDLVQSFKDALLELFLRRRIEGRLPDREEAKIAAEHIVLWEALPEACHDEVEAWIDEHKAARLPQPVADYVSLVRQQLVAGALGAAEVNDAPASRLLKRMTPLERRTVESWAQQESAVSPARVAAGKLQLRESSDVRRSSRVAVEAA